MGSIPTSGALAEQQMRCFPTLSSLVWLQVLRQRQRVCRAKLDTTRKSQVRIRLAMLASIAEQGEGGSARRSMSLEPEPEWFQ